MTSQLFQIMDRKRDPMTVLDAIVDLMIQSERCYPTPQDIKVRFARIEASAGRAWGVSDGSISEITFSRDPVGFKVEFEYDEYSRGCHMGTSRYTVFVPDEIVALWESKEDVEDGFREYRDDEPFDEAANALDEAILKLTKQKIAAVQNHIAEEARKAEVDRIAKANATYEMLGAWHSEEAEAKYQVLVAANQAGNLTNDDLDDFLNMLLDAAPADVVIGYARRILTVDKMRFDPAKSTAWTRITKMMVGLLTS